MGAMWVMLLAKVLVGLICTNSTNTHKACIASEVMASRLTRAYCGRVCAMGAM